LIILSQKIRGKIELKEIEQLFLDVLLNRNKVSIDVGANIGCYTETMLSNKSIVYAYEPVPELYKKLLDNFGDQDCLIIKKLALSDKVGKAKLYIPIVNNNLKYGWSSCYKDYKNEYLTNIISVDTTTLDSENIKNVGLIKIDVEGFEQEVIRGGFQTIKSYKPNLIVELEERHRANTIKDTYEILQQLGYKGLYIDILNWSIQEFDCSYNKKLQQDFFAGQYSVYIYNFIFISIEQYDTIFRKLMKRCSIIKKLKRMRSD